MKRLKCIMLIDDNPADNFLHTRSIRQLDCAEQVKVALNGKQALEMLTTPDESGELIAPELLFLDINMPIMNGWEFVEAYKKLPEELRSGALVLMLTTSMNPDDRSRAEDIDVIQNYATKPMHVEALRNLLDVHFPARFSTDL